MAFMDQMRSKLTQAGQNTAKKAKDLTEVARLNGVIAGAERQISELYGKIGYGVYCAYCKNPIPEVKELIEQVNELHQTIEESKAQIKVINAADLCPQCGAKINKGMTFCSGCGFKLPEAEQPVAEAAGFCSKCGAQVTADSVFCISCGEKLK